MTYTNTYDPGDEIRLTATYTDINGDVADPTAALITVTKPNRAVLTYLSATGWTDNGDWDADANSPALADGTGTAGDYYTVTAAGSQEFGDETLAFAVGDRIYYNGKVWRKLTGVQATTLTKPSTGVFYVDQYLTNLPGDWRYGSDGIGARAAGEDYFTVRENTT